jgi:hypothetical protein
VGVLEMIKATGSERVVGEARGCSVDEVGAQELARGDPPLYIVGSGIEGEGPGRPGPNRQESYTLNTSRVSKLAPIEYPLLITLDFE